MSKFNQSLNGKARAKLLSEFTFTGATTRAIQNKLAEARYTVRRGEDGVPRASTYWRAPLRVLWSIMNGRYYEDTFELRPFESEFILEGQKYSRNKMMYDEPSTRADIKHAIKDAFAELGYTRVYFDEVAASTGRDGKHRPADTFVKVKLEPEL